MRVLATVQTIPKVLIEIVLSCKFFQVGVLDECGRLAIPAAAPIAIGAYHLITALLLLERHSAIDANVHVEALECKCSLLQESSAGATVAVMTPGDVAIRAEGGFATPAFYADGVGIGSETIRVIAVGVRTEHQLLFDFIIPTIAYN